MTTPTSGIPHLPEDSIREPKSPNPSPSEGLLKAAPTSGKDDWELFDEIADIGGWTLNDDGTGKTSKLSIRQISKLRSLIAQSNQQAYEKGYSTGVIAAHLDCADDKRQAVQKELEGLGNTFSRYADEAFESHNGQACQAYGDCRRSVLAALAATQPQKDERSAA